MGRSRERGDGGFVHHVGGMKQDLALGRDHGARSGEAVGVDVGAAGKAACLQ